MNCGVIGRDWPKTACILVQTEEDGVRLFQNEGYGDDHAEDFVIHYLKGLMHHRRQ